MEKVNKKRLLSGIQPSGQMHIGNYFGALKQFVDMQKQFDDVLIFIADLHALTTINDGERLRKYSHDVLLDYLAAGLDPEHVTIYKQSSISSIPQLAWIFNCMLTMPYLSRAHAFKDKTSQGIESSVGLFTYPVLMAADILIMDGEVVPVGEDQQQHIEIARDIAGKFNNTFGSVFVEPAAHIHTEVATVPGTDGRKMSKSYNNTIPLFVDNSEIEKSVMNIVTDSKSANEKKNPEECNIFTFHKLFSTPEELVEIRTGYENGGLGYGESKKILIANIEKYFAPMLERRKYYEEKPDLINDILSDGARRANTIAEKKMDEVRKKLGLL